MKNDRLFLNWATQVFEIFTFTIILLNIFCLFAGDTGAKNMSTLFSLGSSGISVKTTFQILLFSFLISTFNTILNTSIVFKKMRLAVRKALLFVSVLLIAVLFIVVFGWFKIASVKSWVLFIVCYGIAFGISVVATVLKEKSENNLMDEALEKFKADN